ncbi:MAG: UvrB/UvrC motif-containing protein [Parachlamydiaceae bacterium]
MNDKEFENNGDDEKLPERPLECGECKKPITVCYTEIVGGNVSRTSMCADCPELHRRLCGIPNDRVGAIQEDTTSGLACGNCGTSLKSVRMGVPLGCGVCYDVFENILLGELLSAEKIPERLGTASKLAPIHIGRAPGQTQKMNPSLRLLALNEALNETLKKEDYEQAALLRDQIKAITEGKEKLDEEK